MANEVAVLVFDVCMAMAEHPLAEFETLKDCARLLLRDKLLQNPKHHVALLTFGTTETDNDCYEGDDSADDDSPFRHITVLHPCVPSSLQLFQMVDTLSPDPEDSEATSDPIEAILVAAHMIIEGYRTKRATQKRIYVYTDGRGNDQVSGEELKSIQKTLIKIGIQVCVIGLGFGIGFEGVERDSPAITILKDLASSVHGSAVLSSGLARKSLQLLRPPKRRTMPCNLQLEIGGDFSIAVARYKKVEKAAVPRLVKYSRLAPDDVTFPKVTRVSRLHLVDDPDVEVDREDSIKAFKYGPSYIPVSEDDEVFMKVSEPRSLKLVCFAPQSSIPRHHLTGETYYVVPHQKNKQFDQHATALSALIAALDVRRACAIVRFIYNKRSSPKIGVLWPRVREELLVFNTLPFFEDFRDYRFPPLLPSNAPLSQDELEAAGDLIQAMKLTKKRVIEGDEEDEGEAEDSGKLLDTFPLDQVYNPCSQYILTCVHHRATVAGAEETGDLPPMPESVMRTCLPEMSDDAPPNLLLKRSRSVVERYDRLFKTIPVEKKTKETHWFNATTDVTPADLTGNPESYMQVSHSGSMLSSGVDTSLGPPAKRRRTGDATEVGLFARPTGPLLTTVDPVSSFRKAIEDGQVEVALEEMKKIILSVVDASIGSQAYRKALDCVVAFRLACVEQEEPLTYNTFMTQELKRKYSVGGGRHEDFWKLISAKQVGLIVASELPDGEVGGATPEEASAFFEAAVPVSEPEPVIEDEEDLDIADFLDF